MKRKPIGELRKQMTPEQLAESQTRAQLASLSLTLAELRQSLGVTQQDMTDELGVIQSALSKLENQEDIQISTLYRYIKALGGTLQLVAHFPDRDVIISQFES